MSQNIETRFRITIRNLDTQVEVSYVAQARNIAHAFFLADAWANKNWPGAAASFSSWRNARPKGGYTRG
jgi:hypothetical protein